VLGPSKSVCTGNTLAALLDKLLGTKLLGTKLLNKLLDRKILDRKGEP
jgi:hypothetical protein